MNKRKKTVLGHSDSDANNIQILSIRKLEENEEINTIMNPVTPEDEKEPSLPKSCYFTDGKRKVDYVLVYPKLERLKEDKSELKITQFVKHITDRGLIVEKELGKHHTTLFYIKIHAPQKILIQFAKVYNIGLTCHNPYYKYKEKHLLDCLTTELTKPNPYSETYKRAEKTLSGQRPNEITTAERSKIVYEILKRLSFTFGDDELTLKSMLDKEILMDAYPIHDGDFAWTEEGPLTDRQLLYRYWANFRYVFREQPIHLIEKYYGPHIAFYFGLVSLYTKMLLIPTAIGIVTVLVGFLLLHYEGNYLDDEVCNSDIILCSDQLLQSACALMKIAFIIDNHVTICYVIICSFWGTVFWNLWQRRQAMLRLRWNLTGVKSDRTMRPEFQIYSKSRRSSITGEVEYYIPPFKKFLSSIFSYVIVLILIMILILMVLLVVEYRYLMREYIDYDQTSHANEFELFTSSLLTTFLIYVMGKIFPLYLKGYSKIIHFITLMREPRTEAQYKRMHSNVMFIFYFLNNFLPLFYIAFVKGFFSKSPATVSHNAVMSRLQKDLCKPSGCLIDLGIQLIMIMIVETLKNCSVQLFQFLVRRWYWRKYVIPKDKQNICGQWEKDFMLEEHSDMFIMYTSLVLQYSFITFFNSSLPIIGLIALIHNLLQIQHDAFKFLRYYRRPIIEKVPDIQGWNDILRIVTIFGTISNAYVVAFRTDFIHRNLYKTEHGTMKGYINSTLSVFATKDFYSEDNTNHINTTYCFYRGHRYHPDHEKKYEPTIEFWHHNTLKAIYFILLENITLVFSLALSYLIPEIPRKVKVKLEYDEKILRAAREAQMEK